MTKCPKSQQCVVMFVMVLLGHTVGTGNLPTFKEERGREEHCKTSSFIPATLFLLVRSDVSCFHFYDFTFYFNHL